MTWSTRSTPHRRLGRVAVDAGAACPPQDGQHQGRKLLARKRPRLRPIYDSVIAKATGSTDNLWEPLRLALRANDDALHHRLLRLRTAAGLPEQISALRVFDVIAWREGNDLGF